MWYHEDNRGGFTFTWQDVLFNRDANQSISFQAEINPNGLLTYRYDLSQADSLSLNNLSSGIATAPCRHCEEHHAHGAGCDVAISCERGAENRLICVSPLVVVAGSLRVRNQYDFKHHRICKTVDRYEDGDWVTTETHTFIYDGWNVVAEFIAYANGTTKTIEYFWSDDLSDSA